MGILFSTQVDRVVLGGREVLVKREDLCCPGGPHFSKMRGLMAHLEKRPEPGFGVLDTLHSRGGWAVARCALYLNKWVRVFYPHYVSELTPIPKTSQCEAERLGATLCPLPAGRAGVMIHTLRKMMKELGGYTVVNGLRCTESIEETAAEAARTVGLDDVDHVVIPVSSGTIAAGVIRWFAHRDKPCHVWLHLGHTRSERRLRQYVQSMVGNRGWRRFDAVGLFRGDCVLTVIDEGYEYADEARPGVDPPFPCNRYYDLKAWRWLANIKGVLDGKILFWNIGD